MVCPVLEMPKGPDRLREVRASPELCHLIEQADILLLGVSRTSKTPTSIYLANRGLKTANIPLVPNVPTPPSLENLRHPLVVGLLASPERIVQIRQNRLLGLKSHQDDDQYIDRKAVAEDGHAPDLVGLADFAAYHPVWKLQQNFGPLAAPLNDFPRLLSWAERVAAIGHGRRSPMTSEQALDVARTATSIASATPDPRDPVGRKPGQTVTVTPDDTGRDPVIGELVASGVHEIVIRRSDAAIGEVCVHFPRAGFAVTSP